MPQFLDSTAPDFDARFKALLEMKREDAPDVDDTVARLEADGVRFDTRPQDQAWLWREALLRDPDGHGWKIYHAGTNRIDPPWRVS